MVRPMFYRAKIRLRGMNDATDKAAFRHDLAQLIDKHGGKLLMENRKGGGARATIELKGRDALKGRDEEGAAESPSPVELEPHA